MSEQVEDKGGIFVYEEDQKPAETTDEAVENAKNTDPDTLANPTELAHGADSEK